MNNVLTARQLAHIFLEYPDAYVFKLEEDKYKIFICNDISFRTD